MVAWWSGLSPLNQFFWGLVVFFTTLFAWQFVSSFTGLVAEGDADVDLDLDDVEVEGDPDAGVDGGTLEEDVGGVSTFRLLSVRSALAFGTLFSWGAALYLGRDISYLRAFVQAGLWGLAGMVVVALFFWALPRLTEEGTVDMTSAIGRTGTVYVNIPSEGTGRVRILLGDRISYVRASSALERAIAAGTPVRVVRVVDGSTLEVEEVTSL